MFVFSQNKFETVEDCAGNYFIRDGKLQPAGNFDNSAIYGGESLYEVIRISDGVPVFFNDHISRLQTGVKLQRRQMIADHEELKTSLAELLGKEKRKDINVKLVFNYSPAGNTYLIYFIESRYPTAEQYSMGVKGTLFRAERPDPEIKIINDSLRAQINQRLTDEKSYEALLVDRNGCITEGSRSNIFFITGNRLITAPDNFVLGGITRKHLIEICRENGIKIEFSCIRIDEMSEFESVIMTGTSPVVLPFYAVDNFQFSVNHHLISRLRDLYLIKAKESRKQFLSA